MKQNIEKLNNYQEKKREQNWSKKLFQYFFVSLTICASLVVLNTQSKNGQFYKQDVEYLATIGTCHVLKDLLVGGSVTINGTINGIVGLTPSVTVIQIAADNTIVIDGNVNGVILGDFTAATEGHPNIFASVAIENITTALIFQNLVPVSNGNTNAKITTLTFPQNPSNGQCLALYFDFTDDSDEVWAIATITAPGAAIVGLPSLLDPSSNNGTKTYQIFANSCLKFVYSSTTNTWYRS